MNAIGYMRVSTSKQENSLDDQIELFTDYCFNKNIIIKDIITEIGSAYYPNQLKLKKLLNHNNQLIIIKNVSRFSRNKHNFIMLLDQVRNNNNTIHFIEENITYSKRNHTLIFNKIYKIVDFYEKEIDFKINSINHKKEMGWDFKKNRFGRKVIYQNNIRKIKNDKNETNIIELIKALKRETTSNVINRYLYQVVSSDANPIELIDSYGNITKKLSENNLDYNTIATILNSYNIMNRGKKWNINSINKILKVY
tara:strand:+ start:6336 stop:7094 length:759 start_codon:yes stop_codon:yes gene_type:complete